MPLPQTEAGAFVFPRGAASTVGTQPDKQEVPKARRRRYQPLTPAELAAADAALWELARVLTEIARQAEELSALNSTPIKRKAKDARDFDVRFAYLAENCTRMATNFKDYWEGKKQTPIVHENFKNFEKPFN